LTLCNKQMHVQTCRTGKRQVNQMGAVNVDNIKTL